jgi:hypothetical protein
MICQILSGRFHLHLISSDGIWIITQKASNLFDVIMSCYYLMSFIFVGYKVTLVEVFGYHMMSNVIR